MPGSTTSLRAKNCVDHQKYLQEYETSDYYDWLSASRKAGKFGKDFATWRETGATGIGPVSL